MPVRALHKLHGTKSAIRPSLERLGGSIVFESDEGPQAKYGLTFLGILLTDEGPILVQSLNDYLTLAYEKAIAEPLRTSVHSKEVAEALQLAPVHLAELGILLQSSPFTSGGSYGRDEWNLGLPADIEDIPADAGEHIGRRAMTQYDQASPVSHLARHTYLQNKRLDDEPSEFWFVTNDQMRPLLESDWVEVRSAYGSQAWKAAVLLSGGIIEGLLLDALLPRETEAKEAIGRIREKKKVRRIETWDLIDLVDVARELGLLRGATSHLGHAIREFRNLIHPGKSLLTGKQVTRREAELAINSVEVVLQDLSDYSAG